MRQPLGEVRGIFQFRRHSSFAGLALAQPGGAPIERGDGASQTGHGRRMMFI